MKIKLLMDIPVAAREGLTKGRVMELLPLSGPGAWVQGDVNPIKLLHSKGEFKILLGDALSAEDQITSLKAENRRLRAALTDLCDPLTQAEFTVAKLDEVVRNIAKAALERL